MILNHKDDNAQIQNVEHDLTRLKNQFPNAYNLQLLTFNSALANLAAVQQMGWIHIGRTESWR